MWNGDDMNYDDDDNDDLGLDEIVAAIGEQNDGPPLVVEEVHEYNKEDNLVIQDEPIDTSTYKIVSQPNTGHPSDRAEQLERWWPNTHTFHFPSCELGVTPLDFTMITGLSIGLGHLIPYDDSLEKEDKMEEYFPRLAGNKNYENKGIRFSRGDRVC
ncbi:hypothetical protein AQUCO_00400347v1 [Aquilegia coerulea]|uniref:Aminotransferase-like plant mobile domain-containing protein n=1 Tax=Aquilegia coerulea TaxID=218851 RepID=A0A2G5EUH8_AQUCA|nr:hypothetical protein AQUCO_00400347v1 [Aquilegia coerulea]